MQFSPALKRTMYDFKNSFFPNFLFIHRAKYIFSRDMFCLYHFRAKIHSVPWIHRQLEVSFLKDLETVFFQNINNVSAMHVVCRSWVSFGSSSMKNYVYSSISWEKWVLLHELFKTTYLNFIYIFWLILGISCKRYKWDFKEKPWVDYLLHDFLLFGQ